MKHRFTILALVALSGLSLVWAFVASLVAPALPVQATYLPGEHRTPLLQETFPITRYVALSGTDSAACAATESACRTIQYAVDVAKEGDTIKVASGVYTEINHHGDLTQVVYLSKTVVLQGGYTTTNWVDADPEANPTMVDARSDGRGMVIWGSISPTVEGFRITGGDAAVGGGNPSMNDLGGGLYICDASPLVRDNAVFSNVAEGGGGLAIESGNPVLSKNLIMSNVSSFIGGGIYMNESNSLLSDNIIRGNVARSYGGGIAVGGGSYILHANIIAANIVTASDGMGGGAAFHGNIDREPANVRMDNNFVVSNSAYMAGGLDFVGIDAVLTNNIIARNTAIAGSGVCVYASPSIEFKYTTFAQNSGIGLYIGDSSIDTRTVAVVTNTIFSGGTGIAVDGGATALLEGTLWQNTDQDWWIEGGSILITGTHNYWGDPDFVDPDAWDYHIGLNSAALNRGVDAGVYSDFEGDMRPMRGGYDLGADELGPAFVVTKHTFPAAAEVGERLTYTIRLTNTGVVSFTPVITDFLPGSVTPGGVLTWTPLLTVPGDVWVQTVPVTVAASHTGPLTNVEWVTTEEGPQRIYTHTLVPELTVTKR
ncbi:MAG: DUF1565 domain-containing protein, partial [Anaerolineae bacterium]|nr:DUF1565 domain-containing protein [Anaerolineae bacterium]